MCPEPRPGQHLEGHGLRGEVKSWCEARTAEELGSEELVRSAENRKGQGSEERETEEQGTEEQGSEELGSEVSLLARLRQVLFLSSFCGLG